MRCCRREKIDIWRGENMRGRIYALGNGKRNILAGLVAELQNVTDMTNISVKGQVGVKSLAKHAVLPNQEICGKFVNLSAKLLQLFLGVIFVLKDLRRIKKLTFCNYGWLQCLAFTTISCTSRPLQGRTD